MIPDNLTMEQVVEKNALVELGGQYWPPDCWTQHHTAVVVPYYGQAQHLQHQPLHYAIYVVNQVNNTAFNRGKLHNMGFWEAVQEEDRDWIFFHDVNLLPKDDRNLYICDIVPAHVSVAIDRLPYRGYLGGVFALPPIHYVRINGFPNTYWGWDSEDDDITSSPGLLARIRRKWRHDGMNSLGCRLLSNELQPLYTSLTVDISLSAPGAPVPG
eukprot:bmy_21600T0